MDHKEHRKGGRNLLKNIGLIIVSLNFIHTFHRVDIQMRAYDVTVLVCEQQFVTIIYDKDENDMVVHPRPSISIPYTSIQYTSII